MCAALFSALVWLLLDLALSSTLIIGSRLDRYPPEATSAHPVRTRHPIFHHTLKPGFDGWETFGSLRYRVRTNSLGFIDGTTREVPKVAAGGRTVFIGDSYTEGLGCSWEQSFVGLFAAAFPHLDVLNAGVSSYSPTIYRAKIKWLLDEGYRFDHVVVMVDVSDIQDEAWYSMEEGSIEYAVRSDIVGTGRAKDSSWRRSLLSRFQITAFAFHLAKRAAALERHSARLPDTRPDVLNLCRSAWTYGKGQPSIEDRYRPALAGSLTWRDWVAVCPRVSHSGGTDRHIDRAIERAVRQMTELHDLLQRSGIALSVGVYPWPAQLHHDDRASVHVSMWKNWCEGRCARFIDAFPTFFAERDAHPNDWYQRLFIDGDTHFNARGNELTARLLVDAFRTTP